MPDGGLELSRLGWWDLGAPIGMALPWLSKSKRGYRDHAGSEPRAERTEAMIGMPIASGDVITDSG